jgi:transcriptional regulator with XRE-family HTH domain
MFAMVNTSSTLPPLGRFLTEQRKIRRWSQNELARRAGVNAGGLSEIVRGISLPAVETLQKLADALDADPGYLVQLAGGESVVAAQGEYDPEAAYLARKITELPNGVRRDAIDILGSQLDSIYKLTGNIPPPPRVDEARSSDRMPPPEEIKDRLASGSLDIKQLRQDLFLALKILSQEAPDVFLDIMDEFESGSEDEPDD